MTRCGTHAIVLGASLAGLVHAVPLAQRFDRVTLVDRDLLPDRPEQRRGVPQGRHVHLLVPGGVTRLEELLPGVLNDLAGLGAQIIAAPEWRFHIGGGRLDLTHTDLRIVGATRPLIESVVRERVRALEGVEVLTGWTAQVLTTTDDRTRVTGVRLRSASDPEEHRTLTADLIVDATGRGSPSPRWLAELGYPPPEEDRLKVDVHYTTRLFHRESADLDGCRHVLVDTPPGDGRGGIALAVEEGRWVVTLVGLLGQRPPADLRGFTDYAAGLWTGDLYDIVANSLPIGDATQQAFPAFSRHRYDRLRHLPESYVVSGDAVCSFDPRFAQGMTVAIAEALELGRVLDRYGLSRVGQRLLTAAQSIVKDAWDLATGSDLAHPEVDGPRPLPWRLTNAYMGRLLRVAHDDPEVSAALVQVMGMIAGPNELMHPRVLARVLAGPRRTGTRRRLDTHAPTPPIRSTPKRTR